MSRYATVYACTCGYIVRHPSVGVASSIGNYTCSNVRGHALQSWYSRTWDSLKFIQVLKLCTNYMYYTCSYNYYSTTPHFHGLANDFCAKFSSLYTLQLRRYWTWDTHGVLLAPLHSPWYTISCIVPDCQKRNFKSSFYLSSLFTFWESFNPMQKERKYLLQAFRPHQAAQSLWHGWA